VADSIRPVTAASVAERDIALSVALGDDYSEGIRRAQ